VTEGVREQDRGVGGLNHRAAAWLAWSLCWLTVALIVCAVANRRNVWRLNFLIGGASAALVGALNASRQPRNPVGWFILGHAFCFSLGEFGRQYAIYGIRTEPGSLCLSPER
jgi:hypothetical protein